MTGRRLRVGFASCHRDNNLLQKFNRLARWLMTWVDGQAARCQRVHRYFDLASGVDQRDGLVCWETREIETLWFPSSDDVRAASARLIPRSFNRFITLHSTIHPSPTQYCTAQPYIKWLARIRTVMKLTPVKNRLRSNGSPGNQCQEWWNIFQYYHNKNTAV